MTQEHPITPSEELVREWLNIWHKAKVKHVTVYEFMATQAARWGADQELEACCKWLVKNDWKAVHQHLRAARRPKPLSLKKQSIALIDKIQGNKEMWQTDDLDVVRRALESLPD